jgi:hypothetical protein
VWPALILALALPAAAVAEVARVLLLEGDVLSDGQTVTALNNTAPDRSGGYAATLNSTGPGGTLSHVWGSAGGAVPDILRTEATIDRFEQTSFETFFDAEFDPQLRALEYIAYSPICNDTLNGFTGLDAVFMNDVPIMVEREPVVDRPGQYWSFGSRPGVTQLGDAHFVGGITDAPGGATQNRVLFFDPGSLPFDGVVVLAGGGSVAGLPDPIRTTSDGISFDYRYSMDGTHYVVEVATETGSTANDNAMVIDGAVATSSGSAVVEGSLVPPASGGLANEHWSSFDFAGITEGGHWLITGDTDADVALDEFIALDGIIVLREGDAVEDQAVAGAMEGAYLNEDGDVAWVWDVAGGALEALGVRLADAAGFPYDGRDHVLVVEGDPVDLDGDGIPEPNTSLVDFTGISTLTISDRDDAGYVNVYVTADVDILPVRASGSADVAESGAAADASLEELGLSEPPAEADARRAVIEALLVVRVDAREGVGVAEQAGPARVIGLAAAPNPIAAGGTTLRYSVPEAGRARLRVLDVAGRLVRTLRDAPLAAGDHATSWDGRDAGGRRVAAGVYFAVLDAAGRAESRRVVVRP